MPDETGALQEIASLLRRRVEQQDEMAKRSEEHVNKFQEQQSASKTVAEIHEEGAEQRTEMMAKIHRRDEEAKREKEKLQQEQRRFQQKLLAELERHNALLERLLVSLTENQR